MNTPSDSQSVGIVAPQVARFDQPLELACGRSLPNYELVYETYGELNAQCSNAVLVCHALSGHHHAAGYHRADEKIDVRAGGMSVLAPANLSTPTRFFVVSLNNLGGCHGSTGPSSTNPATGKPWGPDFPAPARAGTGCNSQATPWRISWSIDCWAAVIGGSLGRHASHALGTDVYPHRIKALRDHRRPP